MTQLQIIHPSTKYRRRVSDRNLRGSLTIEAALATPLFLFAVLSLIYIMEVHAINYTVEQAAISSAKLAAQEIPELSGLDLLTLRHHLVSLVGSERLDRSIVVNGSSGLSSLGTWYEEDAGVIHVKISYKVKLPFPEYTGISVRQKHKFLVKAWTGYQRGVGANDETAQQTVYVTENGAVYHTDPDCTYLHPSITVLSLDAVETRRNSSGGRYHSCELCEREGYGGSVYITSYGDRYHNSRNCSGLKRTIHTECIDNVGTLRPCSKCAAGGE